MNWQKWSLIGSLILVLGLQIVNADPMIFDADNAACQNMISGAISYPDQMSEFLEYSSDVIKDKIEKINGLTFSVVEDNQSVAESAVNSSILTQNAIEEIKEATKQQGGSFIETIKNHKLALAGVVAVISLGGLTYYLYSNGKLNLVSSKTHNDFQNALSYKKTLIAGLVATFSVALYAAYRTGYVN